MALSLRDYQFKNQIAHVNIETGEGFCRIFEFWENENLFVGAYTRYEAEMAGVFGPMQPDNTSAATISQPSDQGRKMKRGRPSGKARAARDLSDLISSKRKG